MGKKLQKYRKAFQSRYSKVLGFSQSVRKKEDIRKSQINVDDSQTHKIIAGSFLLQ